MGEKKIKVFRIVSMAEYNNNNNTQDDCSTLDAISYQQDIKKKKKGGKGELKTRNTTSVLTLVFLVVGFHYYLYKQS